MSIKKLLENKVLIFSILGLTTVLTMAYFHRPDLQADEKNQSFVKQKRIVAGKPNSMMEISIENLSGLPDNNEQEIVLKATIVLNRTIDQDLNFKWILPDDVSLVSGHIEDGWHSVQVGQELTTEITVIGLSRETPGKAILLHLNSMSQGQPIGASGVYEVELDDSKETMILESKDKISGKTVLIEKSKDEVFEDRLKNVHF